MSFSTDLADLVAAQLTRFASLNRHQLSGHVENLDFWLSQVANALTTIDEYGIRFVRLEAGQEQYVATHGTVEFDPLFRDPYHGPHEFNPAPPRRVPDRALQKSRRGLIDATTRFLDRCRRDGLIPESQWSAAVCSLGLDPANP